LEFQVFEIYSKPGCSYCDKAKALLSSLNIPYTEKVLDTGQVKESATNYYTVAQLQALVPNVRTVPQIFKDGQLIGGFDALKLHLGK